jgi:hypothetical protein
MAQIEPEYPIDGFAKTEPAKKKKGSMVQKQLKAGLK